MIDPVFGYLALSGLLRYVIYYRWQERRPRDAKLAGTVTGLHLFPFKSALGIEQTEILCRPQKGPVNGPITDRHWMVVTDKLEMISSRQEPLISKIVPRFEGDVMIISVSGFPDLSLDSRQVELANNVISTDVHAVPTEALDCGDEASKWISNYLSKPGYRLVYSGRNHYTRGVVGGNKKYLAWTRVAQPQDTLAFHDSISLHIIAEESMKDLNTRLEKPLDALRFRPNIVVKTESKPYEEDTWKDVFIGETKLRALKLCARCVLPNVDPTAGQKSSEDQPLNTLRTYRALLGGVLGPALGLDLVVVRPGIIRVGDPIYVVHGDNIAPP